MNGIKHKVLPLIGAALLIAFSGQTAADEIYRWVDANGVVNYTQLKPKDTEAEAITTQGGATRVAKAAPTPAPASVTDPATGEPLSPEQEQMLEGLRAAERARQQEIAKIKAENCQQSKDVLARLTVKERIRVRGEDGDYRVMPEDERASRISEAQKNIALYCASA
ncbi:MAG: DUF4124 domain-containing protein [Pseudomonadales bacterium]